MKTLFKDIYKAANDCIKGDPKLLSKILSQNEEAKVKKFKPIKYHYIATSLAAVFIVCLSLFVFPEYGQKAVEENINPSVTLQNDSSEEIKKTEQKQAMISDKTADNISEKTKKISPKQEENAKIANETDAVSGTVFSTEQTQEEATEPAREEMQQSYNLNAPMIASSEAYENDVAAYDSSNEETTTEDMAEEPSMAKAVARASGGGGGASLSSNNAYILNSLPEGFHEVSNSGSEITYENADGTAKITSGIFPHPAVPEANSNAGGIYYYRDGGYIVIQKGGITYTLTFENISDEEINNIISNNF